MFCPRTDGGGRSPWVTGAVAHMHFGKEVPHYCANERRKFGVLTIWIYVARAEDPTTNKAHTDARPRTNVTIWKRVFASFVINSSLDLKRLRWRCFRNDASSRPLCIHEIHIITMVFSAIANAALGRSYDPQKTNIFSMVTWIVWIGNAIHFQF